jgi:hypothetical protein
MWFSNNTQCGVCGKTDFKKNLIKVASRCFECFYEEYRHEECHMKEARLRKCSCGKGYVKIEEKAVCEK